LNQNDKAIKDIDQVLTAGLRAKKLVNQILTFSRREEGKRIPLVLTPFIKEVINFLKATLPKYIRIQLTNQLESGIVLTDPIQLQQILMNLCANASQAIGSNRGVIEVILTQVHYPKSPDLPFDIKPGDYVKIEIKDDGPGINDKIIHKIFDPFFTTKGIGEGTGLGLSMVHGIIKKHEGGIFVESQEDQGTCFSFILPRIEHEDIQIEVDPIIDLPTGTERILLVDDEIVLLNILDRILTNLGYDIQAYNSSKHALKAFTTETEHFDLVITDQIMPEMAGTQLINEIRKDNPTIPIILFTGIDEAQLEDQGANQIGFNRLIRKPLRNADLAFIIRKVLDEKI